jgi:hypothetical protein
MSPRERAVWMLFLAILIGVLLGAGGDTAAVFQSIPTVGSVRSSLSTKD